jgi:Omp85 superfamily domain
MNIRLKLLCFVFLVSLNASAQKAEVVHRIFLAGDGGELKGNQHPVCDWLKKMVDWNDTTNVLVYLGDNIYPLGMPAEGTKNYAAAKRIIDYQVSVVKDKKAKAIFIPGNHDWRQGKPGGWLEIQQQQQYLENLQLPNVEMLPKNGCPDPVEMVLSDKLVMVFMDSQWWLHQQDKPGLESDCACKSEEAVVNALKDIIGSHPDKLVLVALHHPFYTYGSHGGFYTLRQHLFPLTDASRNLYIPLPVIGSIYPLSRAWFGNIQDRQHPQYKNLIERVEGVLKSHPNVVVASGHDHNLQLLQHDSIHYIVSGSASKINPVKKGKYSLFAKNEQGVAVIEISSDRSASVRFYSVNTGDLAQPLFSKSLPVIASPLAGSSHNMVSSFPDSVTVAASKKFKAGGFKRFLLGANYRKEWNQPIRVEVFNMQKEMGGLRPLKRGGGHQSKSLRLEDSTGKQYVIRSVEKFITDAALPPDLRGTIAKDLVSDGVSASYPFAAFSVPDLAEAAGIPHAKPRLVYIPDDPLLGKFRIDFANTLCVFEEREPGTTKKNYSTDEMDKKRIADNDNAVDQRAVLQARLLDMFMMDFDRHEDQWRWGATETDKGKMFYPIPRDRDQPFFMSQGVFPYFASRPWIAPQIQGFRSKAKNILVYNFNARNFDRAFLNELNEVDWQKAANDFLPLMTDELIERALRRQPGEIQGYSMNTIIQKLKDRRKYFAAEMRQYYRFLSKVVTVTGSDKKEIFEIVRNTDGTVLVKISKVNKDGIVSRKIYERIFDGAVTKEIRLYGMGGDDKFLFTGEGNAIKIRVIGGNGQDSFEQRGEAPAGKTWVYDQASDSTRFSGNHRFKKKLSNDPLVNNYQRIYYKYDLLVPFVSVNYNIDDGIYLGASLKYIRQGFRKLPYSMMHQLVVNHSLATNAYNIRYNADFIKVLGKADILIRADIKAPNNVTNFFSYGNESVFDKKQPGKIRYYRARFQLGDVVALARKNIGNTLTVAAGPAFQFYSFDTDDNKNRFITQTNINGLEPGFSFLDKSYLGGQATITLDNRNSKVLPTRGINWQTSFRKLAGLNAASNNLSQLNSEMALFFSFNKKANVVIANRVGAGINYGAFEFFQAQYLGGTDNLRGFRKYRFAGKTMLYNNTDLRIKIADFRTYLFPGSLGMLFFYDMGRVWTKSDNSSKWHKGYGGGFWLAPLKKLVIAASLTASDEEILPLISFGFQF